MVTYNNWFTFLRGLYNRGRLYRSDFEYLLYNFVFNDKIDKDFLIKSFLYKVNCK